MLVIIAVVVAGIRPTARVQVALAAVEYVILHHRGRRDLDVRGAVRPAVPVLPDPA